tara:strand:+ start:146 stop:448 length:303 start_codon:yes stop_codon:yes gene_type:complete
VEGHVWGEKEFGEEDQNFQFENDRGKKEYFFGETALVKGLGEYVSSSSGLLTLTRKTRQKKDFFKNIFLYFPSKVGSQPKSQSKKLLLLDTNSWELWHQR